MEKKLIDVAKEMNTGIDTIVTYLNQKGFDITNRPIAKLSAEMYNEVAKKFQDSFAEKRKAESLNIAGSRQNPAQPQQPTVKKDVETIAPIAETQKEVNSERPKISLTPRLAPVKRDDPKTKVVVPQPAITPATTVTETPKAVESTPTEVVETSTKAPLIPQQPARQQQGTGSYANNTTNNNQNKENKEHKDKERNSNNNRDRNSNNNNSNNNNRDRDRDRNRNKERKENLPKYEPKAPTGPIEGESIHTDTDFTKPDEFRADAPQLKGLTVLGKIDLSTTKSNSSSGGSGRDRDRRRGGNNDNRNKVGSNNQQRTNTGGGGENQQGGQGNNNNNQQGADGKRPRKKVPNSNNNQQGSGQGNNNNSGNNNNQGGGQNRNNNNQGGNNNNQGGGQNRNNNNQGGNNNNQGGGQNRNNNNQGQGGGGYNRNNNQGQGGYNRNNNNQGNRPTSSNATPQQPKEVSQKEIEDKIKATMARIGGGNNRGKGVKNRRDKRDRNREREELRQEAENNQKLQVTEFISVSDLASLLGVSVSEVITACMSMGYMVGINQRLDAELIEVVANEFGQEVEFISAEEQVGAMEDEIDDPETLQPRAPIVTVMGHVDHGKTSLLDYIRKANVVSGEAGGITQHIGAYEVVTADNRKITFLDTPGHEAFTAMRARGAKVTDVAVIIIAADDNIMPQTKEAISHAQAAGVPMVFAINKIDKAGAAPERIKQELASMNILVEEWGGKFQSQDISAKQGLNVDLLLEKILLEADLLELKANPDKAASGTVIEASLEKGRGYVTKVLVQSGTLSIGDPIVVGENAGKIRAMFNERGKKVLKAGPSTPVLVLGLSGAPQAGEKVKAMPNESEAKEIANKRAQIIREQSTRSTKRISLDEIGRRLALGTFKELNLIIKGDVDGSVEALADSLLKQSHETVSVRVIHKAVGQIIESDILLASASDAIIIGFQVRPSLTARKLAEREGVEIKTYSIIYEAIDEIRDAIEGMLEPTKEEKITAQVEVREVYKIGKVGTVAGCYVQEGKIARNNHIRIIRDGIVVFPLKEGQKGELSSLKRFKDDQKEVRAGFECGMMINNYNDIQMGDTIESYEIIEVKQKLEKSR